MAVIGQDTGAETARRRAVGGARIRHRSAAMGGLGQSIVRRGGFGCVTLLCALAFPNRPEELRPELWARAAAPAPAPAE